MNSRTLIAIALFSCILTLTLSIAWMPTVKASNTWTVDDDLPADFTHIQDAINAAAAGDTILVYPGTYNERYVPPAWASPSLSDVWAPAVVVYKDGLTIKAVDPDPMNTVIQSRVSAWLNPRPIQISTNYGVNPAGGIGASTLIIVANYTTIDGFRIIRAWDGTNEGGYNMAPVLIGGLFPGDSQYLGKAHDNTVKNCILGTTGYWFNTPPPSTYPAPNPYIIVYNGPVNSWTGVYIWHSSNNLVENNIVYDVRWRALQIYDGYSDAQINLGFHSKNNQFIGNEIYNAWGGLFVGAWAPTVWPDNSGTTVKDNYFHDLTDFAIGFGYTNSGGIAISGNNMENTKSGIISVGPVMMHDSLIDYNYIRLSNLGPWQVGIQLNRLNDVTISHNDIQNNMNGWAIAIYHSKIVSLECNDVINNAYGIAIVNSTDVEAHCNNIVGNGAGFAPYGPYPALYNSLGTGDPSQYIVNATNNWWGNATGPYHATSWLYLGNPYGPNPGSGDSVSDYVLYDPWLISSACQPVGGEWAPINTFQMLVQLIGSIVAMSAIVASFVGFKRIRKRQN